MTDLDLAYTPATELALRIRARELSPVEVVENSLARINEVNPALNCFCFTFPDEALDKARAAEQAVMDGKPLGPLHGVPVAIKDLTPTKGKRTTLGSRSHEHNVPDHDAVIVEKLLGAGAIMVGKTMTPEFAYSSYTESPLWGITRNPWNTERSPGGSSGGSGAAVASGCVPFAEGSDMGGSVRIPAALCGITGLKPSFGRIPFEILPSQFDQISHFGPLARTVGDAALFLSVAQGPDERDIQSQKPALDIPIPPPTDLSGMSLALCPNLGYYALHPDVEANCRAAAEALTEAGATVTEVDLPWNQQINEAWGAHWGVYLAAFFGHLLDEWRDTMDPNVVALMDAGLAMSAVDFKRLEFIRTEQWKALSPILEQHHALLCPTMALPANPVGTGDQEYDSDDGLYHGYDMTEVFNFVSQCPVYSVPSGFAADGLPTALQIVGRRFDDNSVLRIGAALEHHRPWADKRPNI
jgi:Asp-tRNA(Asn)/Glu-tRNA(Gln) amidotransferase A subunit family amidase